MEAKMSWTNASKAMVLSTLLMASGSGWAHANKKALASADAETGLSAAHATPPASLEDQLKAYYKLARVQSDANGPGVVEQGTVLVIQRGGILGIPPVSLGVCAAKYQNGDLQPPGRFCEARFNKVSRSFPVQERVYVTKIDVKSEKDNDTIRFSITACDACNGVNPPSMYKSAVDFVFPRGYLDGASAAQLEDIIGQVFAIDKGNAVQAPSSGPPLPEQSQVVNREDFTFELKGCSAEKWSLTCEVLITNHGEDRTFNIRDSTRMIDDHGNTFQPTQLQLANVKGFKLVWGGQVVEGPLVSDTPTPLKITFEGVAPEAGSVALLEIGCGFRVRDSRRDFSVEFRHAPIWRCDGSSNCPQSIGATATANPTSPGPVASPNSGGSTQAMTAAAVPPYFLPILQPGWRTFTPGFSASGDFTFTTGYIYIQPGATASYSFTAPGGQSQTVSYGILGGHVVNNGPVDVFVDGVKDARIEEGIGGYGQTAPETLILWTHTFSPGRHKITLKSVNNSVNVYGLWFGTPPSASSPAPSPTSPGASPTNPRPEIPRVEAAKTSAAGPIPSGKPTGALRRVAVPVVACPLDTNLGPETVSVPASALANIPTGWADQVSFYSFGDRGILAPKGWQCHGNRGTSGTFLSVTPGASSPKVGIWIEYWSPDASGRSTVFDVGSPLFADIRRVALIEKSHSDALPSVLSSRTTPWPGEIVTRPAQHLAKFCDPPHVKGTGDRSGGEYPVCGAVSEEPNPHSVPNPDQLDVPNLTVLSVLLPANASDFANFIVDQAIRPHSD
jgi:hypothetical protein